MLCRDRCGYCTFAKAPARLDSPYLDARRGPRHRPGRTGRRLPRGALHPGRGARGPLPGRRRVAGRPRLRLDRRLPGRRLRRRARGDRPAPPRQRRGARPRRAGPAPDGLGQPGDDDRVAQPRPRRPPLGARQGARRGGWPPWRRPASSAIPFTTGLLVGIGESRAGPARHPRGHRRQPRPPRPRPGGDRPELPAQAGHRRCTGTPPCPTDEFLWTIAAARLLLPADIHLQAPPNLSDELGPAGGRRHRRLGRRLAGDRRPRQPRAGLAGPRASCGRPPRRPGHTLAPAADPLPRVRPRPGALARPGAAVPGARRLRRRGPGPRPPLGLGRRGPPRPSCSPRSSATGRRAVRPAGRHRLATAGGAVAEVLAGVLAGETVDEDEIVTLFGARGPEVRAVAEVADQLRARHRGRRGHLRRQPEHQLHQRLHLQVQVLRLLQGPALAQPPRRALPARAGRDHRPGGRGRGHGGHRGLPAGRHPPRLRRRLLPRRHPGRARGVGHHPHPRVHRPRGDRGRPPVRASPWPTTWSCCATPACGPCPGTAAEILDDEVRAVLCPDKIDTEQWLEAHRTAHAVGLNSNVTIMFGAIEQPRSWARHLVRTRALQARDRRLHRVRAAAVRAHGHARSTSRGGPAGARPSARRCSCTPSAASPTAAPSTTSS